MQIQWTKEDGSVERLAIPPQGLTIGRNAKYDIYLPDSEVSGSKPHACIVCRDNSYYIIDCNSKNGTRLNDKPLPPDVPTLLTHGARIKLGNQNLECLPVDVGHAVVGERDGNKQAGNKPQTPSGGKPGDTFILPINSGAVVIGRSPNCDIVLDDSSVSSQHAELLPSGSGFSIRDLGSKNGTFVNETRISGMVALKPDDRVRIGRNRFKLPDSKGGGMTREQVARLNPVSDGRQIRLDAYNLRREVMSGEGQLTLLDNVSLSIEPGAMVAVIGGSGAGKTTLMLALNGYVKANEGQVLLNGMDFYENAERFSTTMGYVPQQDIVHGDLPVASALRYAAQLRLPPDTTDTEIETMVDKVLDQLSLSHRKNNLISTLSGGQRKRVNIGVELLTRPSILFLDEPTTGLDAGTEKKVTFLMRELAQAGCTIITVTHAVQTLEFYDKVVVMAPGGRLVYYGPLKREDLKREFGLDDYADLYDNVEKRRAIDASQPCPSANDSPVALRAQQSSMSQWSALTRRYAEIMRNDRRNLIQLLAQTPFVAMLIMLLFKPDTFSPNQPVDPKTVPLHITGGPRIALLMALTMICFCLLNSYREIIKEVAIYNRERHVSLRIWPYMFSKLGILSVISALQIAMLVVLINARISLELSPANMLRVGIVLMLGAVNASLLGLLVSSLSKSSDQATTTAGLLLLAQVIFSGFIPIDPDNKIMKQVGDICAMHWMYGSLGNLLGIDDLTKTVEAAQRAAAHLPAPAVIPGVKVPPSPFILTFSEAVQHLTLLAVFCLCLVWLALWLPEEMARRKSG